jgi:hypothetical protein
VVRESSGVQPHTTRASWWLSLLLAFVVACLIAGLRAPDRITHPQFWAEDAFVFYADAEFGGSQALLRPGEPGVVSCGGQSRVGRWAAWSRREALTVVAPLVQEPTPPESELRLITTATT